jgi:hypothetical protein
MLNKSYEVGLPFLVELELVVTLRGAKLIIILRGGPPIPGGAKVSCNFTRCG